jgi:tryptophan-rich sensory protein
VNTLRLSFRMMNPTPTRSRHPVLGYFAWLALCFAASASAVFVSTGGWYAELHKPTWNPPAWVFSPAWTLLYILMATAAWLVWREGGWKAQGRALSLFLVQWLLNALWTPLFFGMHQTGLAFAEIVLLWVMIVLTLNAFWKVKPSAGLLMLPYLAWVTYAAALNFTIWRMNL